MTHPSPKENHRSMKEKHYEVDVKALQLANIRSRAEWGSISESQVQLYTGE